MAERTIRITILGDEKQAVSALKNTEAAAGGLETKVTGLGGALSGFGGVAGPVFAGLAVTGVAAVGALGVAVVKTGIDFNSMREQAQIAFTTMLGDGGKAKVFLDNLAGFAASTPFEFPELVSAAQKMIAFGFSAEDVIPMLTDIGNAAAGLGIGAEGVGRVTTALGQMQVKGKATGEEMAQLTESGIAGWKYLAEALGVSVSEAMDMVSKGAVSADTVIGAVRAGMQKDFGGMMEAQSKSFSGLLSTLKDTFAQVSGQLVGPLFAGLTQGMQGLVALTSSPDFTAGVQAFSQGLVQGFAMIGQGLQVILPYLSGFASMIQTGFTAALPVLQQIGTLVSSVIGAAFQALMPVAEQLFAAFQANLPQLQALWTQLQAAIAPLLPVLQILGVAIGATLVLAVGLFAAALGGVIGFLSGALPGAITFVSGLLTALQGIFTVLSSVIVGVVGIVVALVHGDWSGAWQAAQQMVAGVVDGIVGLVTGLGTAVVGLFQGLVGGVIGLISGFVGSIVGFFQGLYDTLVGHSIVPDMVDGIIQSFANLASTVLGAITTWVGNLVTSFTTLATETLAAIAAWGRQLVSDFQSVGDQAKEKVVAFAQAIATELGTMASQALSKAAEFGTNIKTAISTATVEALGTVTTWVGNVVAEMAGLAGKAASAVGDLGAVLVGAGKALLDGLLSGIRSKLGELQALLSNVTNLIPDWKGPPEKDALLLYGSGQLIMDGLINGIDSKRGALQGLLGDVTSQIGATFASQGGGGGIGYDAGRDTDRFELNGRATETGQGRIDRWTSDNMRDYGMDETNARYAALARLKRDYERTNEDWRRSGFDLANIRALDTEQPVAGRNYGPGVGPQGAVWKNTGTDRWELAGGGGAGAGYGAVTIQIMAPVYGVDHMNDVVLSALEGLHRQGRL